MEQVCKRALGILGPRRMIRNGTLLRSCWSTQQVWREPGHGWCVMRLCPCEWESTQVRTWSPQTKSISCVIVFVHDLVLIFTDSYVYILFMYSSLHVLRSELHHFVPWTRTLISYQCCQRSYKCLVSCIRIMSLCAAYLTVYLDISRSYIYIYTDRYQFLHKSGWLVMTSCGEVTGVTVRLLGSSHFWRGPDYIQYIHHHPSIQLNQDTKISQ